LTAQPSTVERILYACEMQRFQDPSIQIGGAKRKYYYIRPVVSRITARGRERGQEVIRLGWCDELNTPRKREAAKQAVMAAINDGRGFAAAQLTLSQIIDQYKRSVLPQLATSTQAKYETHLRNHIGGIATCQLCEITPPLIEEWLGKAEKVGKPGERLGDETRADVLHILSALFEAARRWRMYEGPNPCRDVRLGRRAPARAKVMLDAEQLRRLLDSLSCCAADVGGITGPDVRLIVEVALATGWRVSEILGLRSAALVGDSIEMRGRWHRGDWSEIAKTPAGYRRNVIGPELAAALRARKGDWVFCGTGGTPPDDRDIQQHILRPCAESVGVYHEGFGMHAFRRLYVTLAQAAGASLAEIGKWSGHTSSAMTQRYTMVDEERQREILAGITRRKQ